MDKVGNGGPKSMPQMSKVRKESKKKGKKVRSYPLDFARVSFGLFGEKKRRLGRLCTTKKCAIWLGAYGEGEKKPVGIWKEQPASPGTWDRTQIP